MCWIICSSVRINFSGYYVNYEVDLGLENVDWFGGNGYYWNVFNVLVSDIKCRKYIGRNLLCWWRV